MVGTGGFEPPTSCTRNKRATRLRYVPTQGRKIAAVQPSLQINFRFVLLQRKDQVRFRRSAERYQCIHSNQEAIYLAYEMEIETKEAGRNCARNQKWE